MTLSSFFQNSTHYIRRHPFPSRRPRVGGRNGIGQAWRAQRWRKLKGPADTSCAYHDHHFGGGALNLPLYDAKPLAVHFRVSFGMGAASAAFPPTVATCGTRFRDAEVWLPWCASWGLGAGRGGRVRRKSVWSPWGPQTPALATSSSSREAEPARSSPRPSAKPH